MPACPNLSVSLVSCTPNAFNIVANAATLYYDTYPIYAETRQEILDRCIQSGHLLVLEHANFTFHIEGLSRVSSQQFMQHRMISFSQQSQRYVHVSDVAEHVVVPPSITDAGKINNPKILSCFLEAARVAAEAYQKLCEYGVPQEDARFILPHGMDTKLDVTMNARELLHFFNLRLCRRAQWEIRNMATKMLSLCLKQVPEIFKHAGPGCIRKNGCQETRPCGNPFRDINGILIELEPLGEVFNAFRNLAYVFQEIALDSKKASTR